MGKMLSLAMAGALSILSAASAWAQEKWDLPAGYPPGNFHTKNLVQFADDVRNATGGKLDITIHAGASLFKVPEIKRAVQTGQAQIGELLMVVLENEDPLFGADNVPFLATSYADARRLAAVQRPFIEKRLADQGMRLLYWVSWPPQGLYAPKPIGSVEDLKGLKFRSYGASAARFGELAGMQVTTVQAAELSQALATGRVNAMITSATTGVDSKVWESLTHYYDVQAWLPKNMIIVNEAAFTRLDEPTRQALLKAASDAEVRGWAESERLTSSLTEELRKNGMAVQPPSPQLKEGLKRIGEQLQSDWLQRAGADGAKLIDAFKGQ